MSRSSLKGLATGALVAVIVLSFIAVRGRFSGWLTLEGQIQALLADINRGQRPPIGRMFGVPYAAATQGEVPHPNVSRAQLLLLGLPDSSGKTALQAKVYVAASNLLQAQHSLEQLKVDQPRNPEVLNDLGVIYLARGLVEPKFTLRALDEFELAERADPSRPEPAYNLALAYEQLRLPQLQQQAIDRYLALETHPAWAAELHKTKSIDEEVAASMDDALRHLDYDRAKTILHTNPELAARVVMQYAMEPLDPRFDPLLLFIANEYSRKYRDSTLLAMLSPLQTNGRHTIRRIRQLVRQATEQYSRGELNASLRTYSEATQMVGKVDSVFDEHWINVNRADTESRLADLRAGRRSLEHAVTAARKHNLKWILASALTVYGSNRGLTNSHIELQSRLTEAVQIFKEIEAPRRSLRALYYLAYYQLSAGGLDEGLKLAITSLRLSQEPLRLVQLYWLIGTILYRQGDSARAILFQAEAVRLVNDTNNPGMIASINSEMAFLAEANEQRDLAEKYLGFAETSLQRVSNSIERTAVEVLLNVIRGRMFLSRRLFKESEASLRRNIGIFNNGYLPGTHTHSQSWLTLAKGLALQGKIREAGQAFSRAVEIGEADETYLQTEHFRVAFDDERRDLYDSAIGFENGRGNPEEAWKYIQQYRAKLFLEFLGQFNPKAGQIRSNLRRVTDAQRGLPGSAQILEYVLLNDRLLIWVMTESSSVLRTLPISRETVEQRMALFLSKLRDQQNVTADSRELYDFLIKPVEDLLDPRRTLVIIPDRSLHRLPFAALRSPGGAYLVERFAVLESPSLPYLLASQRSVPKRDAIVSFGSQQAESSSVAELAALQGIYKTAATYAGSQVDKPKFLAAMHTTPVVHYAGHSVHDAANPLESAILLDGNQHGPDTITAVDIAERRVYPNALVVLSSCDSSVGNSRDGVAMRGLTSAFLIGGAGSVVGSLWPVETVSTSDLMVRFHKAFAEKQLPAVAALREAQLGFLKAFPDKQHPYFWSGFVVTGNFSAMR